jgi:putative MATE family efflux protein
MDRAQTLQRERLPALEATPAYGVLLRQLLVLALPVLLEQLFHTVVGLTDTWLANNLPRDAAAATSAVGTISYVMWLIGMLVGMIGTGSTALISRAKGARHRRLANSVCGQSVVAAAVVGLVMGAAAYVWADLWVAMTGLNDQARVFALSYLRIFATCMPFMTVLFVANACLRGVGDTLTPALSMIVVDVVNVAFSYGLTYGKWGLPHMGFDGIAAGTAISYAVGGVLQIAVLLGGRGGIRLHAHRMRPHWNTMRRILRIGLPNGVEGFFQWAANFLIVVVINRMDAGSVSAAAHMNAVRIESLSYLPGFAFAIAAATMVGQSLGMRDWHRARRSGYLAYAVGGGIMTSFGLVFILFGRTLSDWMLPREPEIAALTARLLFVAGWGQVGFAAAMILSGALRGAGDTMAVMRINLASILGVRLVGVLVVVFVFGGGVVAVWAVLMAELMLRGVLAWWRFAMGKWRHIEV